MTAETSPTAASPEMADQEQLAEEMADRLPRNPRELLRRTVADYRLIKATKYGVAPLAIIFVLDLVQGIDSKVPGLLFPEIRREFNASLTSLALMAQLFSLVGIATVPALGYFADRLRRTRMVAIGQFISGGMSMITAGTTSLLTYQASRSLDGLGESINNVPSESLLLDYYPLEARSKTYSLRQIAGGLIGLLLGPAIGITIVRFGWRSSYMVTGPLVFASGFLALRLREPVRGYWERLRAGEQEETARVEQGAVGWGESFRTMLQIKTLRRLMWLIPLSAFGTSGFEYLHSFYLADQFHLNALQRQLVGLPASVVSLFALLFGGVLSDALIKKRQNRVLVYVGVFSVMGAVARVLTVLVPNLGFLIAISMVTALFGSALSPAAYAIRSRVIPPRMRGALLGVLSLLYLPTIPLGVLPGYVGDHFGVRMGMLLFSPVMLLSSVVAISAARFFAVDQRAVIAQANATNEYTRAKEQGLVKLLLVRDVDVDYNGVQVLFNVDLSVDEGEMVALLGTNGAGKSTLLRAISGVREASSGAIFFDGADITHLPPYEIARRGIVHMPGGRAVFPGLTVRENLDLATLEAPEGGAARLDGVFGFFPELRAKLDQRAGSLSGGEQQMVGLAQAFVWKPRLLMIDELSLGLAPAVVTRLLDIVRAINAEGATVILVEQSVNVSLTVASRAVFMEKGEVRFDGPVRDLFARPDIVRSVYLKASAPVLQVAASATAPRRPDERRALLEVEGLTKFYGGVAAVEGVSFVVHEGEALGLIGPNGAGKTTVFDLVSGYLPPDHGIVRFDGVDITRLAADQRGRLRLVRRFQDAKLFPALTVFESVCVALDRHLAVRSAFLTALQLGSARRSEARLRARADRLIEMLELGAYRDAFVSDLSTGVRRVADLACVLAAEPRLLLLDEPSSGIAQAEAEALAPLLRRVRFETGCSLLIIEHDMHLISLVSDELLAMVQGRVVTRGAPDEVLAHPLVVAAYLGDDEAVVRRSGALQ